MKKILAVAAMLIATSAFAGVLNSKHDMAGSPARRNDVCYYCHAAHNTTVTAPAPLWARPLAAVVPYYKSSTISVNAATLDVVSQACMTCHDGTVDVNETIKGDVTAASTMLTGRERARRRPSRTTTR